MKSAVEKDLIAVEVRIEKQIILSAECGVCKGPLDFGYDMSENGNEVRVFPEPCPNACLRKSMKDRVKNEDISLVQALRVTMEAYNRLRSKWINDHQTDEGFDSWFTNMILAERSESIKDS